VIALPPIQFDRTTCECRQALPRSCASSTTASAFWQARINAPNANAAYRMQ
jgi:hypothetical protein